MKMILDDTELEEIRIEDVLRSSDNGVVITPKTGNEGEEKPQHDEITKEIAALDSLQLSARKSEEINGVSRTAANKYANGENVEPETRARILSAKHNIADVAITKLMDSLNLFDPSAFEKQKDLIQAAGTLAGIVERVSSKEKGGNAQVILNLYAPKQNKLSDYEVIEVQ